jgi:hypothetical protein
MTSREISYFVAGFFCGVVTLVTFCVWFYSKFGSGPRPRS